MLHVCGGPGYVTQSFRQAKITELLWQNNMNKKLYSGYNIVVEYEHLSV